MDEQWQEHPQYAGYQVSDRGDVRGPTGPLTQYTKATGHKRVRVRVYGRSRWRAVHRLVLETFIGPCPEGMEACHWNDVPDDNRLANLRWGTRLQNMADRRRNRTG